MLNYQRVNVNILGISASGFTANSSWSNWWAPQWGKPLLIFLRWEPTWTPDNFCCDCFTVEQTTTKTKTSLIHLNPSDLFNSNSKWFEMFNCLFFASMFMVIKCYKINHQGSSHWSNRGCFDITDQFSQHPKRACQVKQQWKIPMSIYRR